MYIGMGTVVLILVIVVIVWFVRRVWALPAQLHGCNRQPEIVDVGTSTPKMSASKRRAN